MTPEAAEQIKSFTGGWGKGAGSGADVRRREFEFTPAIAKYSGGNWDCAYSVRDGIALGALPNLLEFLSQVSEGRIKANFRKVEPLQIDSDRIFAAKPPFILFTGTRDFKLTEKEVANLQKYVRLGGAIWGDSPVPGRGSPFEIAFRREMKRVMPDMDKDFVPLEPNDPLFKHNPFFPELNTQPPGLNQSKEPASVMRYFGSISIIFTINGYSEMWRFGLAQSGKEWTVVSPPFSQNETAYFTPPKKALEDSYKFAVNLITHLLTRWEDVPRQAEEAGPLATQSNMRDWGPEQATGEPNTLKAGDFRTAWASLRPDSGLQWLEVAFEKPVAIAQVRILETFNPGAVIKVSGVANGKEVVLWEGKDTTAVAPSFFVVHASAALTSDRVRIYLDTDRKPGWNEIDAVELVGKDGTRQWAKSASASSTYAERGSQLGSTDQKRSGTQSSAPVAQRASPSTMAPQSDTAGGRPLSEDGPPTDAEQLVGSARTTRPLVFPAIINGRVIGQTTAAAGSVVDVLEADDDQATVRFGQSAPISVERLALVDLCFPPEQAPEPAEQAPNAAPLPEAVSPDPQNEPAAAQPAGMAPGGAVVLQGRQEAEVVELGPGKHSLRGEYTVLAGQTLVLRAGAQVLAEKGASIAVSGGTILVQGEPGGPVSFSGRSPATGGWSGLKFDDAKLVDIAHASIVGADIGMTLRGCKDARITSTVVAKCNTGILLQSRTHISLENCLITANREHGIRDNMSESSLQHCSLMGNSGWGYFCEYYGSPTFESCVIEGNKAGGIKGASYDAYSQARNSVFESNGGPCVAHSGTKDWDYSNCWWGESNTKRLASTGDATNLRTIEDQLDDPKVARVHLHGFLTRRPQDAGSTLRWPLATDGPRL
jgi:hypothetical protein